MNAIEIFSLVVAGLILLLWIVLMIHAIYFYCVHYDAVSEKVDGHVFDGGFLFSAMRIGPWGVYCLSKRLARRNGVAEAFESLPKAIRRHLIFHSSCLTVAVVLMVAAWVLLQLEK